LLALETAMLKHSQNYDAFASLVDRLLTVPPNVITQRIREERQRIAATHSRPEPRARQKRKAVNASSQARFCFSDLAYCLEFLSARRWKDGVPICPICGSDDVSRLDSRPHWQCKTRHPRAQFSVKSGTIFENSVIGLDKWLAILWMIANRECAVSSYEVHCALGITQKTAWFMLQRIRLAMQDDRTGVTLSRSPRLQNIAGALRGAEARLRSPQAPEPYLLPLDQPGNSTSQTSISGP
jgi:hypothetical protein